MARRHADFDEFWESTLDFSAFVHNAVMSLPADQIDEMRASLAERLAPFTADDGSVSVPGRTLVAVASA